MRAPLAWAALAAAMVPDTNVVGLCGSLRDGSFSRMALALALEGAAQAGATTELIDLREYDLSFVGKDDPGTADDARLRAKVKAAQGLVIATPEYHGSFSGVIKNALDLLGFEETEGKMIGLVAVSGGAMGGIEAMNALRAVGRALHAWVVPNQAGVPRASKQFRPDGTLPDAALAERLREVGRQVASFARLHNSDQAKRFLEEWEAAVENPGG